MQRDKVVVIGGGGHAKVVIDILQSSNNYEIIGFTSPLDSDKSLCGVPYVGDDSNLPALFDKGIRSFFIAIGDNKLRKKLYNNLLEFGFKPINAISPYAHISPYASIGDGVVVMPGSVINACAVLGDNIIVNTLACIDHDCIINSHTHIAPRVSLAGCVNVGEGSFIGIGSSVIPEIKIGEWVIIGAGSAVISDIPSNVKVVGVPARKYI
ncbi:acetyltransferase [Paenibacillus sp. FSL H8-0034]|uniref:acetyltransferase n=1 Tax=Paenibacillus sp. FSL H8-0034 TaxID=2954671 RepID=UPI0030F689EC